MASLEKFIERAVWYCASANLGYDQLNRWDFPPYGDTDYAGECDCSSLLYQCAVEAGFNVPTSGTRYTGTVIRDFTKAGFEQLKFTSTANLVAGDVLYKEDHVAIWSGRYICEAYIDESGGDRGGRAGDQANETRLSEPRGGWDYVLRYPQPADPWPRPVEPIGDAVDYPIAEGSNNVRHAFDQPSYYYRYVKWASGRLQVWISDYFNAASGNYYEGEHYVAKTLYYPHQVDAKAPAFSEPPLIAGHSVRASSGWVQLQLFGFDEKQAKIWAYGTRKSIPKFSVDVVLEGTWK